MLHASSAEEAELSARGLRAVGLVELPAGYVVEPAGATEPLATVTVDALARLVEADAVTVLDVREPDEYEAAAIPGSRNLPYRLVRREGAGATDGKPVVTVCESGPRAALAASLLARAGVDARAVVDGGVADWPPS